ATATTTALAEIIEGHTGTTPIESGTPFGGTTPASPKTPRNRALKPTVTANGTTVTPATVTATITATTTTANAASASAPAVVSGFPIEPISQAGASDTAMSPVLAPREAPTVTMIVSPG